MSLRACQQLQLDLRLEAVCVYKSSLKTFENLINI